MKRSRNEILSAILQFLAEQDCRKTKLVYSLNLAGAPTTGYLDHLMTKGLVTRTGWIYRITPKGRTLAELLKHAEEQLV